MQKEQKKIFILLYFIFFLIGCFTFKDYGVGIEENFQRASGFYWLNYISNLLNLSNIQEICKFKLDELYNLNPNLPRVYNNLAYGIIFDVPTALLEIIINFEENKYNIYLKHFLSFFTFLISSFFFTQILIKRFKNFFVIFFGTIAYFLSPKIYGASFFDGKDIFFLSIFTISIYFYLDYEIKKKIKNLIIFALFASFVASSRLPGFLILFSFLLIYFFKILCEEEIKYNLKIILIFIIIFFIFLFIQWPYLWNIYENFRFSIGHSGFSIYFNGQFYKPNNLPLTYIPKWVWISTPIYIVLLSTLGCLSSIARFYKRLISVKDNREKIYKFDFWRGKKEKFDFFILICLYQTIFICFTFDEDILSSWRHFYFAHFFIAYYFSLIIYKIFLKLKNHKKKIISLIIFLFIFSFEQVYKLYVYHPYQNIYFNNLLSETEKLKYERDTAHLSRLDALKEIIKISKNESKKIRLGSASWSPLNDVLIMFNKDELTNIELVGNENLDKSDYIFTNYMYDVNINFSTKYNIPKNYELYKTLKINNTLIYSLYKKK